MSLCVFITGTSNMMTGRMGVYLFIKDMTIEMSIV